MHCIILASLFTILAALATSDVVNRPLPVTKSSLIVGNASTPRVAVPFGNLNGAKFSEPSLVHTASEFDIDELASDQVWETYIAKGTWYTCLLDMTNEEAGTALGDTRVPSSAESAWQGDLRTELFKWGWFDSEYDPTVSCDFRDGPELDSRNKIGTALSALGLSLLPFGRGGDNECVSIEHFNEALLDSFGDEVPVEEQTYSIDGTLYPATGAYYRFAFNTRGGAIFAQNLLKPSSAAQQNLGGIADDRLPSLSRASDIIWSYWTRNHAHPQNLRFYFANYIRNDATLPLVTRALKSHGLNTVPYWPGLRLGMEDEGARAVLGSPIGATLAHLLFQHKASLGLKHVASVTIFRDNFPEDIPDANVEVHLLFEIGEGALLESEDEEMVGVEVKETGLSNGTNFVREFRIV